MKDNIIFITLDGVRNLEFFRGSSPFKKKKLKDVEKGPCFPKLIHKIKHKDGKFFGSFGPVSSFRIASRWAISLPSYQSMYLGKPAISRHNGDPAIPEPSFAQRLVDEAKIPKTQVACIASWDALERACQSTTGAISCYSGLTPVDNPTNNPYITYLNNQSTTDLPPWNQAKWDAYTWDLSLKYMEIHQPRFLHISLNDADMWGHTDRYDKYVPCLRWYDEVITKLVDTIPTMGEWGQNTTIFVTTDHSRGWFGLWKNHGNGWGWERSSFLYVKGPLEKSIGKPKTLREFRPFVEKTFGLEPVKEDGMSFFEKVFQYLLP